MKTIIISASLIAIAAMALLWLSQDDQRSPANAKARQSGDQASASVPDNAVQPRDASRAPTQLDEEVLDQLHPTVRVVVGPSVEMSQRRKALRFLSRKLEATDLTALMDFINLDQPDLRQPSGHALVDAIINGLRVQETYPDGFSQALLRLHRESPDTVLQSYAIQYLGCLYMDRDGYHRHETNPAVREKILKTLITAASQTEHIYSGTALIALHRITMSPALEEEPVTRAQLAAHAEDLDASFLKAAISEHSHKRCRISAMQLCAIRGQQELLPVAREVAADTNADASLRISAIAAIGQLGSLQQDGTLLKGLKTQGLRLAHAATPALQRLAQDKR